LSGHLRGELGVDNDGADVWAFCCCLPLASGQMYRELRVRGKLVHPWPLDSLCCFAVKDEMPALYTTAAPDGIHTTASSENSVKGKAIRAASFHVRQGSGIGV